MAGSSGKRRRRSSHSSGRFLRDPRRLVALGGIVAIVVAAAAVAVVLGGPAAQPTTSGTTPGASQPGVGLTGSGNPYFSLPAIPSGPPSTGPSTSTGPTASTGPGIRATRIVIARLGIDLPIVDGDGIDAPIGKAAHYPGSAWPGGGSNIYIYGHARVGMFLPLWQARVGDVVVLYLVDGTTRSYVVTKILPTVPWDAVTYLAPTPTEQLTLQTSTSYYATAPRFVVIALPKP
ncbi:MAG: sortase [Candidatus Limnocylindrales bacterium]